MQGHEQYEELCALAAGGQLSEQEYSEFSEHLNSCPICELLLRQFTTVLDNRVPVAGLTLPTAISSFAIRDTGYVDRFMERARSEGIDLPPRRRSVLGLAGWQWPGLRFRYAAAFALVSMLVLGVALFVRRPSEAAPEQVSQPKQSNADRNAAELAADNSRLKADLASLHDSDWERSIVLEKLSRESYAATQRVQQLELELRISHESLKQREELLKQVQQQLQDQSKLLADAHADFDKTRNANAQLDAELAAQQHRVADLSEQVRLQATSLDMERKLVAAGKDVRDLMGARNLHLVDVHDYDSRGRAERAFGRIFYTEGRSLVFYAFDLNDKKVLNAKASFQAWGQRLGRNDSTRSLGIFYVDDRSQRRWVLKVDDPNLLKEIDSVFVTLEPGTGGKRPSGDPLLNAFLGSQPNHP